MKKSFLYSAGLLLLLGAAACKKDNYTAPGTDFTGHITYQGEPIGVQSGTQGNASVYFELWQSGYGKLTPINVNIAQDGSFSAKLYNGTYRMDFPTGQGPYLPPSGHYGDTISITLSGNNAQDIEVLPYYMIRDPKFTFSAADSAITATFRLDTIVKDPALVKGIEKVYLLENSQIIADIAKSQALTAIDGASLTDLQHFNMTIKVPASQYQAHTAAFARIGVKIAGVEDMLYSQAEKINL